jgi:hypothetical protein
MSELIQRAQTGVHTEIRLVKALKALAEQLDMPPGDLLEGMALRCFEGKPPFSDATLGKIKKLKEFTNSTCPPRTAKGLEERGNDDQNFSDLCRSNCYVYCSKWLQPWK